MTGKIMDHSRSGEAARETATAARNSIIAAVILTAMKLAAGLATNSLGMLSEAAHSGLDLVAAAVTFWAVRYASAPPDEAHPFGHGKAENLAALIESLLLLLTCAWVVYEAVDRLFFDHVAVEATRWALLVMLISIAVDYNRSRMLLRVAKKHKSQALEADALHFSTDIWSSAVVVLGLGCVWLASFMPADSLARLWLEKADALAAMGVCLIIFRVSLRLGRQAINVLLDAGDNAMAAAIRESLSALPGLVRVDTLRARHGGPTVFVEALCRVDGSLTLEQTARLREQAISRIREAAKQHADISIQLMPERDLESDPFATVRQVAAAHGLLAHAVELVEMESATGDECGRIIELHVEMDPDLSLGQAHETVSGFEKELLPLCFCSAVVTHIEPRPSPATATKAIREEQGRIRDAVASLTEAHPEICDCHNILVRSVGERFSVTFHCRMDPSVTVLEAHRASSRLQSSLHGLLPELDRVTIHLEPLKTQADILGKSEESTP